MLSVLALPFHVMITYSGLLFFGYFYMAPVISASYGAGEAAQGANFDEMFDRDEIPERVGAPAALVPIALLLREAEHRFGQGEARFLNIYDSGDTNA